jgi:N-acetylmuramoyl-L-alanine amidase
VILTHDDGKLINMDLDDRVDLANDRDADIFVSIHSDSYPGNPLACGMATYYYHGNGNIDQKIDLATEVQDNLALYTGRPNNGIKLKRFFVIKNTDMPSILVEVGFLSNAVEEQLLQTSSFRSLAAEGIVNGILTYFER